MRRRNTYLVLLTSLILFVPGALHAEDTEAAFELPRVGTLGTAPSDDDTIVVSADQDGRLVVDGGKPVGLKGLDTALRLATSDPATREVDRSSGKRLLLRIDRRLPWRVVQWILMTAAGPTVGLYKIHFAALPREGDGEGALRLHLPKDRGLQPTAQSVEMPPRVTARVQVDGENASDPEALFPLLLRLRAAAGRDTKLTFEVVAPSPHGGAVPSGFVVRMLDVAVRAGFRNVHLEGARLPSGPDKGTASRLRMEVVKLKKQAGTPTILVAGQIVGGTPDAKSAESALGLLDRPYGFGTETGAEDLEDEAPQEVVEELDETHAGGNATIGLGGGAGGAFAGRKRPAQGTRTDFVTAVNAALEWLGAHQSPDGSWDADGFQAFCDGEPQTDGPTGAGKAMYDPGVTGLALLAFLRAGYTNRGRHPYAKTVSKGLRYLKDIQDAEGCFGPRRKPHFVYNHALASLAMIEAYGMTASPIFKGSAQKALDFIAASRNPNFAWRYGVRPGDNDTSITAWMASALIAAKRINEERVKRGAKAPLTIDETAFHGIERWLQRMTDAAKGRTGYIQTGGSSARPQEAIDLYPAHLTEAMTAASLHVRLAMGQDAEENEILQKGIALLEACPPEWHPKHWSNDMIYWYFGTEAMWALGLKPWKAWNKHLRNALLKNQRKDTTACLYLGSWDPCGPWGREGGRVYSTAILAMCLEVHYRHHVLWGTK